MKKYYSILLMALVTMVGLASCSDSDGADYTPASIPSGAQVFFPTSNPTSYTLSMADGVQTIDIPIARGTTGEAVTVDLQLTIAQNAGIFSIPSQISFAAGESETIIPLSYNAEALGYDNPDTLSIAIVDENFTTPYGASATQIVVRIPSPWTTLGYATITDDIVGPMFGLNPVTWKVEIQENDLTPGYYRLINPYNTLDYPNNEEGDDISEETHYMYIHAEDPEGVYIPGFNTGLSWGDDYGEFYFVSFGGYYIERGGYSVADIKAGGYAGQLQDGVISFPVQGMLLNMPNYSTGLYYANNSGMFTIVLPGYAIKDHSFGVTYTGKSVDTEGENFALFTLTLGADVDEIKYALVPAVDAEDAIYDIREGGGLKTASATASGDYQIQVTESGRYALVVVAFADGKAVGSDYILIKYDVDAKDVWKALGVGLYTEDVLCSLYGAPAVTYEVEIEESLTRPGVYRLVNAYGENFPYNEEGDWDDSKDYYIEVNAQDPEGVFIERQATGLDWGDGEFLIQSYGSYYLDYEYDFNLVKAAGLLGTLEDGVITFPEDGFVATLKGYGSSLSNTVEIVLPNAVTKSARAASKNNKNGHSQLSLDGSKRMRMFQQTILSKKRAKLVK